MNDRRTPMTRSLLLALGLGSAGALASVGTATGAPGAASAAPAMAASQRYPFDPACPWGRISDGKGLLVRCLSEEETRRLLGASGEPSGAPDAPAPSAHDPAGEPSGAASPEPAPGGEKVSVQIGPVTVDEGKLPLAEKRLQAARSRIAQCFDAGGLRADQGEVVVRFLVRARGRAEGVSVARRTRVTVKAARCVADVIDRRWVGQPEGSQVPGSVVIRVSRSK